MKYVQLRELRDLVLLLSSASSIAAIQHLRVRDSHLYFLVGGTLSEAFVYFVKLKEEVGGRYVIYNALTGDIRFSPTVRTDPNVSSIPVVDISSQNILPKELIDNLAEL